MKLRDMFAKSPWLVEVESVGGEYASKISSNKLKYYFSKFNLLWMFMCYPFVPWNFFNTMFLIPKIGLKQE